MNQKQASDAVAIQRGACNPRAIARALVASIDKDARDGWQGPESFSPATRLILHQLAYILTGRDIAIVPLWDSHSASPTYYSDSAATAAVADGRTLDAERAR